MRTSDNVRDLQPSATLAVAALCRRLKAEGRDVLDLSAGEPDFRTPEFAGQAGIAAIEQGSTHYTPVPGTTELRAAVARYLTRTSGKPANAAGVVVSNGAKQALFNACFTLFGPGDDVLIPSPYWTSYPEIVTLARARSVFVPGDAAHLRIDPDRLERARTPATRGIILNSPANPSGAVYSHDELEAIASWAATHGLWLISDEIYSRLVYDDEPRAAGILDLDDALLERAVLIDGVSKAWAMTGWRIGFSYSSPALADQFASLQSHITSGASSPAQAAACAAYQDEVRVVEAVNAMVRVFRRRREHAARALAQFLPSASFIMPGGAFFFFIRVDSYYTDAVSDSITFCNDLVERTGVALVPGAAFGDDRYVRLSFACPEAEILEGIRRIGALLEPAAQST